MEISGKIGLQNISQPNEHILSIWDFWYLD